MHWMTSVDKASFSTAMVSFREQMLEQQKAASQTARFL